MATRGLSYSIPMLIPLWGLLGLAIPISGCRCGIGKAGTQGGGAGGKLFSLGVIGDREIGAVGVFRSPYNLPQACGALFIYIS